MFSSKIIPPVKWRDDLLLHLKYGPNASLYNLSTTYFLHFISYFSPPCPIYHSHTVLLFHEHIKLISASESLCSVLHLPGMFSWLFIRVEVKYHLFQEAISSHPIQNNPVCTIILFFFLTEDSKIYLWNKGTLHIIILFLNTFYCFL